MAAAGTKKLEKGQYIFRENDPSDAMYVVKSGKIAIVKAKGPTEIVLAELGPGQMLGEMAFFDNRPRSASAKALAESEVIALPFKALYAQFKTFPEWLRAMVKTVNTNLREANQRIKHLEKATAGDDQAFPPTRIVRLCGILGLVGARYGTPEGCSVNVPFTALRRYTIQVFGEPTNKMQRMLEELAKLRLTSLEDLGEGRLKILVHNLDLIMDTTDFYTDFLFKEESKRTPVEEPELKVIRALIFYGRKSVAEGKPAKEAITNLSQAQAESMRDLGFAFKPEETASLSEKKLIGERMSGEGGTFVKYNLLELERLYPMWEIVHTLLKIKAS